MTIDKEKIESFTKTIDQQLQSSMVRTHQLEGARMFASELLKEFEKKDEDTIKDNQ